MKNIKNIIDRLIEVFAATLLTSMVAICLWQVFSRYILQAPSSFSEEYLRYTLIALTLICAPYAYGKDKHLAVIIFAKMLNPTFQKILKLFVELTVTFFAVVILIMGGVDAGRNAIGQVSSALGLQMQYLYFVLPVSGVLFLFYIVLHIPNYLSKDNPIN